MPFAFVKMTTECSWFLDFFFFFYPSYVPIPSTCFTEVKGSFGNFAPLQVSEEKLMFVSHLLIFMENF